MFREMRLKEENQLSQEQTMEILEKAVYGVLALERMVAKYAKGLEEGGRKYAKASWNKVLTFAIEIEHITGKKGTP